MRYVKRNFLSVKILLLLIYDAILVLNIANRCVAVKKAMLAKAAIFPSGIKLSANSIEDQTVFAEYRTVSGGIALLPCNVTIPSPDDAITLILWYRGNASRIPIYTVDAREEQLENATHFRGDIFAGNRASFDLSARPALLRIYPVREDDGMEYRCRVDFRWGRTMNTFVSLNVVVPPRSIAIRDVNDTLVHNTRIGPYSEDSDISLACETFGGMPPPILQWYRDNVMIDGSYIINDSGRARNDLIVYKLSRSDLSVMYTCQASNFNATQPLQASVTIDINLSPLTVSITSPKHVLSAGRKIEIVCETKGSRPPAVITWLKNKRKLTHSFESVSTDGNTTTSVLNLMPTVSDDGEFLICRAENPRLPNKTFEEHWKLHVFYDPKVILTIGKSITKSVSLREGSEAVMECQIKANPVASDIQFLLNGSQIMTNEQTGVIVDNTTLTLESLKPSQRGRYKCTATNLEGKGESNELSLDIRFTPICKIAGNSDKLNFAVAINESLKLKCTVDAQPNEVSFYWSLNNYELHYNFTTDGLTSELLFTPRYKQDFGIVSCLAKNAIGLQQKPCIFAITLSGPPLPPASCAVANKTITSITISCISVNAGSKQRFFAQVFDSNHQSILKNVSVSKKPLFVINGLSSGTDYLIVIYAINDRGKSVPIELVVSTMSMVNSNLEPVNRFGYDNIVAVICGALSTIVLIIIIIVIICKIKQQDEEKERRDIQRDRKSKVDDKEISGEESTKQNPDVIPFEAQSYSDLKSDVYLIGDYQKISSLSIPISKPKSILVNGNIPNGNCIKLFPCNETTGDNNKLGIFEISADVIVHQTKVEDFSDAVIQQTAV